MGQWTKPRARPNAKGRAKLTEACKRRWEGEGQVIYEPHSYHPYFYEGQEYGAYDEPYAEDDYGHHYFSPHRQDRRSPPPQWSSVRGRRSVRARVDTSSFGQSGSSTWRDAGRKFPHGRPVSSKASAALGAPPPRFSPMGAPGDTPVRTQAPQAGSSNHKERTTQIVQPSPRRTRPTLSGLTYRGPPTPPVALSLS